MRSGFVGAGGAAGKGVEVGMNGHVPFQGVVEAPGDAAATAPPRAPDPAYGAKAAASDALTVIVTPLPSTSGRTSTLFSPSSESATRTTVGSNCAARTSRTGPLPITSTGLPCSHAPSRSNQKR